MLPTRDLNESIVLLFTLTSRRRFEAKSKGTDEACS